MKQNEKITLIVVLVLIGLALILIPKTTHNLKKTKVDPVITTVEAPPTYGMDGEAPISSNDLGNGSTEEVVEIANSDGTVRSYDLSNTGPNQMISGNKPGQFVDLQKFLNNDNHTSILYFHSSNCPACLEMEPCMNKLAAKRRDLAIVRIDIDRPDRETTIDFHSPAANQFNVTAVPSFRIYDGTSKLIVAKGPKAKEIVRDWYNQLSR